MNGENMMRIAKTVAENSKCLRRKVGAVIVKKGMVISTGYNGPPRAVRHCDQVGCVREMNNIPSGERQELCNGLHAEQNAIVQAAYHGIRVEGSLLFCTHQPCLICAKMIINAGIKCVVFDSEYPDEFAVKMLKGGGVRMISMQDPTERLGWFKSDSVFVEDSGMVF